VETPRIALAGEAGPTPAWLESYRAGDPFPRDAFFGSRVVFYPGSGTDGDPLQVFGGARAAHCFVFADYGSALGGRSLREVVTSQLSDPDRPGHPRGFVPVHVGALSEQELRPGGWSPHLEVDPLEDPWAVREPEGGAFAVWAVLERRVELDDSHGAERLAIVFVGGEGIATFDALFCQGDAAAPFGILLQDHGFGGNWTRFGGGGSPLWKLARQYARPKWLLVAENTSAWPGYERASEASRGGMHRTPRCLYHLEGPP
jgi:hypothetical protein